MSAEAARQDFITTFILDSDVVPRMSLHSVEALRNEVLQAISRIKVPKHKIRSVSDHNLQYSISQVPDSEYVRQLEALGNHREKISSEREFVRLVLPGLRLIQLVKSHPEQPDESSTMLDTRRRSSFVPVYAEPADFREVTLRKNMIIDHTPSRLISQFDCAADPFQAFEANANIRLLPKISL
jgi:sn1-specific diacylglycerol lipase